MNKKYVLILILFALLVTLKVLRVNQVGIKAAGGGRVHNLNTGLNYTTIQEAIDDLQTTNGHVIFVERGTYYEHVVISKSILLVGEEEGTTIVDGNGTGTVIQISANNVSVINFTIRNAGKAWNGKGYPPSCISGNNVAYVNITNNIVMNTLEGIDVEKSHGNVIAGNQLVGNNVSIVLNQCNGLNTFRENNMTSNWYNLIVWGWTLDAFIQDFGTTNIVNDKRVYYFTNSHDLFINTSNCANIGYLAIVNCTNMMIKDIDLSYNRDGLLLAQSTNCTLLNITLNGNRGPLFYGGLTLFKSSNNIIVNSLISNNSVGICAYQSNGNIFYHNAFVNNTINVISNFYSPFSQPTGLLSKNIWDNGYPEGGNYWAASTVIDLHSGSHQNETGSGGIADNPYFIDENNQDNYPLMGMFYDFETVGLDGETYHVQVISNSTVSELNLAVWLSSPNEYLQPGQEFLQFYVEGKNDTSGFCRVTIPRALLNDSYIVLVDCTIVPAHQLEVSNSTHAYLYFTYNHTKHEVIIIPEFTFISIQPLFLIATLIMVTLLKAKAKTSKNQNYDFCI